MKKRSKILIAASIVLVIATVLCSIVHFVNLYIKNKEEAELLRLAFEYYSAKLSTYEAENETYDDYEIDAAFIGDSLTDGYDLGKYYPGYTTANRGIGGDTTFRLEERLAISLYDLKPKVAVMLIGGNNLDTMFENYEDILIGIRDNLPNTRVILVSLTAMGGDFAKKNSIAAYNNVIIKKLAAKYGFEFVDIYTPLFDETTGEIYADCTSDGAHLTDRGYQILTEAITTSLSAILNSET